MHIVDNINISRMVYNCIMPIIFLDSASTSEQRTVALIQV